MPDAHTHELTWRDEAVFDSVEAECRKADLLDAKNSIVLPRSGTGTEGRFVAVEVSVLWRLLELARRNA